MTTQEKAELRRLEQKLRKIAVKDPFYPLDIMEVAMALKTLRKAAK